MKAFIRPAAIFSWAKKPFTNLSPGQKVLLVVRIGSPLIAIFAVVIIFALQRYPQALKIAQINCAHLSVATGLYQSLRSLMTESIINKGSSANYLPIDTTLSDSEITILALYALSQVANAPQSFILGLRDWCTVNYATNLAYIQTPHVNVTTHCEQFGDLNLYDYRTLLKMNQLEIILAYAYERDDGQTTKYKERVAGRYKRFHLMTFVLMVHLAFEILSVYLGLAAYNRRGTARDLSLISKVRLNTIALLSLLSGMSLAVTTAIVVIDLFSMQKEIEQGLGDFGISMSTGSLFVALAGLAFISTCLGMFSWILPLWCSNPPEDGPPYGEELVFARTRKQTDAKENFIVKPYQVRRHTPTSRASSRLFDHTDNLLDLLGNPFADHNTRISSPFTSTGINENELYESSSKVHSESDLRKLGEKLARNTSVRQLGGSRRPANRTATSSLQTKDTRELLYGPNPFSNHQYPQAFPKPLDAEALSRAATLTYGTGPFVQLRTRHLLGERGNFAQNHVLGLDDDFSNVNDTLLDEDEMEYLDNTRFINHLSK